MACCLITFPCYKLITCRIVTAWLADFGRRYRGRSDCDSMDWRIIISTDLTTISNDGLPVSYQICLMFCYMFYGLLISGLCNMFLSKSIIMIHDPSIVDHQQGYNKLINTPNCTVLHRPTPSAQCLATQGIFQDASSRNELSSKKKYCLFAVEFWSRAANLPCYLGSQDGRLPGYFAADIWHGTDWMPISFLENVDEAGPISHTLLFSDPDLTCPDFSGFSLNMRISYEGIGYQGA